MKRYALHAFANQIPLLRETQTMSPAQIINQHRVWQLYASSPLKIQHVCTSHRRPIHSVRAADLLLMNLKCISISHVKRFRTVGGLYTATIEEEPDRSGSLALSLAEGIHQLLEGGGALDLEEDFIVVVGNFDVEMLTLTTALGLLGGSWASVVV